LLLSLIRAIDVVGLVPGVGGDGTGGDEAPVPGVGGDGRVRKIKFDSGVMEVDQESWVHMRCP
jgi:hypothetical protein